MAGSGDEVTIGGRAYYPIGANGPLDRDLFVMKHSRHAGVAGAAPRDGETIDEFGVRILDTVLQSGRALILLGGFLLPEGKKTEEWTEEMAYETAGHLGRLTDAEDKKAVTGQLATVMFGFFASGVGSWIASSPSSAVGAAALQTTRESGSPGGASGTDSSGSSEGTTPTGAGP